MVDDSGLGRRSSARASGRQVLGRGLDALLPSSPGAGPIEVDIERIDPNPNQPRQRFDRSALEELAGSIKEHGIVQPLVVSATGDDRFRLIVGERRLEAAKLAGLTRVPIIVKEAGDRQSLELALIENLQRSDLNPLEEAAAYQRLIRDFGLTQQQVGEQVGKSRVAITNTLRLLALPETLKRAVVEGRISEGHARALLQLPQRHMQLAVLDKVEKEGWSVRQTEERVRRLVEPPHRRPGVEKSPDVRALEKELRNALGATVSLRHGKRGGRIIIDYGSEEEFQTIYLRLTGER
jgi:ParB family chromosome partitioning protein